MFGGHGARTHGTTQPEARTGGGGKENKAKAHGDTCKTNKHRDEERKQARRSKQRPRQEQRKPENKEADTDLENISPHRASRCQRNPGALGRSAKINFPFRSDRTCVARGLRDPGSSRAFSALTCPSPSDLSSLVGKDEETNTTASTWWTNARGERGSLE
ncbi:unnamed protein product [Pleuronectes platessa]|uniref:Uncharacterized protein n=1 Tax=Pleuronectes platessa TaxID=8262 RepID=A0A9N7YR97_PLEPL|nr:unnamed protein product [Pleuronectes platessa]